MSASTGKSVDRTDWSLGQLIKRAEQLLAAHKSEALREFDLTVPQHATLLGLSQSSGLSGAQLARLCGVTPQTMATILGNLEQKGWVEREPSEIHAKVLVTRLSRSGRAVLKKADGRVQGVEQRLAEGFGVRERGQLHGLLERAVEVLER
ncbi:MULTISPECIES: MarR family transcriptional regulator [unclassified Streptomyces]|uniref:MarR family winged helix-turn-helix transcriptional regulator n=1 Tax=unclassified Streptomyces TaxID=2593676 RepID=UPI001F51038F|nr:MarR family transcriptional regulator [Streptomyces sp. L2]